VYTGVYTAIHHVGARLIKVALLAVIFDEARPAEDDGPFYTAEGIKRSIVVASARLVGLFLLLSRLG
jgi:hypothetical protein